MLDDLGIFLKKRIKANTIHGAIKMYKYSTLIELKAQIRDREEFIATLFAHLIDSTFRSGHKKGL